MLPVYCVPRLKWIKLFVKSNVLCIEQEASLDFLDRHIKVTRVHVVKKSFFEHV